MSDTPPIPSASTAVLSSSPPPCATSAPQDEPRALSEVEEQALKKLQVNKQDYLEWVKKIEGGDSDALGHPPIKDGERVKLLELAASFLKLEKLWPKIRSTDAREVESALQVLIWAKNNKNPEVEKIVNSVDLTYWFQKANRDFREPGLEDALDVLYDFGHAGHLKAHQLRETSYAYKSRAAYNTEMAHKKDAFSIIKPGFKFESFQLSGAYGINSNGKVVGLVSIGPVFGFDKGKDLSSIQVPLVFKYSKWNSEDIIGGETGLRFNLSREHIFSDQEYVVWSLSALVGGGAITEKDHPTSFGIIPALRLGLYNIFNLEAGIMTYSNSDSVKPGQFYVSIPIDLGEFFIAVTSLNKGYAPTFRDFLEQ
jgi:hypothetical protein